MARVWKTYVCGTGACVQYARVRDTWVRSPVCARHDLRKCKNETSREKCYSCVVVCCMLLVCSRMYSYLLVYYSYVLVSTRMHSYVLVCTRMYSYVLVCTLMLIVCTRMLLVCARMYSYVNSILIVCTRMCHARMLLVCTRVVFQSRLKGTTVYNETIIAPIAKKDLDFIRNVKRLLLKILLYLK